MSITAEYRVTGMTCEHCERAVRDEVGQVPGVVDIAVSAATGALTVSGPTGWNDAAVLAAVDEAGYQAVRL